MDEPLGALDKQLREHMQYEIKHLHERLGVTVVYVTHDQSEALTMSDRIAVFNDGRIQQLATPADLYERPENSFVAQFIGENNRLAGVTRAVRNGRAEVELQGGAMVEALAVKARSDAPTRISIRPERVDIDPDQARRRRRRAHRGESIYLGDHIRLRMRVFDNDGFIVKLGNGGGAAPSPSGKRSRSAGASPTRGPRMFETSRVRRRSEAIPGRNGASTRRGVCHDEICKLSLGVSVAALVSGCFGGESGAITIVSWGGAYTKAQTEAYQKPWMAKTGNTIVSADYNGGLAEVKSAGRKRQGDLGPDRRRTLGGGRGCNDGLFEKLDPSKLPKGDNGVDAKDDFIPGSLLDCAVGTIAYANIYGYNSTKFPGDKPTKVADFFDLKKFPGKRGLKKEAKVNLEMALMADGVPAADVYKVLDTKEGVDRAFKKLDTIKGSAVFWEAGAQPPQLLASGEVMMTTAYNGRLFTPAVHGEQAVRHRLGRPAAGVRHVGDPQGIEEEGRRVGFHRVLDLDQAARRSGQVHSLWSRAQILGAAGRQISGRQDRHGAQHADQPGQHGQCHRAERRILVRAL